MSQRTSVPSKVGASAKTPAKAPLAKPGTATAKPVAATKAKGKDEAAKEAENKEPVPAAATEETRKRKKIVIPFVIPWENTAAKETQKGMGAFGTSRNPVVNHKEESYHPEKNQSEGVLGIFAETNKFASQQGSGGFGHYRNNVCRMVGGKEIDPEKRQAGEGIIPKQAGSNLSSQSGQTPIGSLRQHVMKVDYGDDAPKSRDTEADKMVPLLSQSNPNAQAGTNVIDTRRRQVIRLAKTDKRSEAEIPKLFDPRNVDSEARPEGTGAGIQGLRPGRQVVTAAAKGGYTMTESEITASKNVVPWATSAQIDSQAGTGGFGKVRDIVNRTKYQW